MEPRTQYLDLFHFLLISFMSWPTLVTLSTTFFSDNFLVSVFSACPGVQTYTVARRPSLPKSLTNIGMLWALKMLGVLDQVYFSSSPPLLVDFLPESQAKTLGVILNSSFAHSHKQWLENPGDSTFKIQPELDPSSLPSLPHTRLSHIITHLDFNILLTDPHLPLLYPQDSKCRRHSDSVWMQGRPCLSSTCNTEQALPLLTGEPHTLPMAVQVSIPSTSANIASLLLLQFPPHGFCLITQSALESLPLDIHSVLASSRLLFTGLLSTGHLLQPPCQEWHPLWFIFLFCPYHSLS